MADEGLLIHCFDSVEDHTEKWRPGLATKTSHDNPSGSLIFKEQNLRPSGAPKFGPGNHLFGHGCADYWSDGWNQLDGTIVSLSIVEMLMQLVASGTGIKLSLYHECFSSTR